MRAPPSDELEHVDALLASMAELALRPEPLGAEFNARVELGFRGSSRLSALERIDIYREQFWLRHVQSLTEDFPATSRLLGSRWEGVARGYLLAHPPCTPSLRELGFQLPEYLCALERSVAPEITHDLARLERAYLEVFDAADEAPLEAAKVGELCPEEWLTARLRVSGALRILELSYPVADLRRALRAGGQPETPASPSSISLAVFRRDLVLWDREISPVERDLLLRLVAGTQLGEACEATARERPDAGPLLDAHLGEWFASWTRLGWITGVIVRGD